MPVKSQTRFLVVAAVAVGLGGAAVAAQSDEQECRATRSGDIVTIDLSTCEEVTPSTTTPSSSPPTTEPPGTVAPTTEAIPPTTAAPATSVPSTTTEPPVTTTEVPATTTSTQPPTTSTTSPPTSTTQPAPPPTGVQFYEDFSTEAGFYSRFDFGMSLHANEDTALQGHLMHEWEGDHNLACSGPDLRRPVEIFPGMGPVTPEQVAARSGKSQIWWWCAPGSDPAKGHLMTATNGEGYQIAWFSPKQTFRDVSRVCWDQNTTDMDAKWTNVVIAPVADVEATRRQKGYLDLGFDPPGFMPPGAPAASQGPTTDNWTPNGVGVKFNQGNMSYWEGGFFVGGEVMGDWYANDDKASRYRICMIDNGNGTVTLTQERPAMCDMWRAGLRPCTTRIRTVPGAFPNGDVRVSFEDDMYDPPKRNGYDPTAITWHWDNIEIT